MERKKITDEMREKLRAPLPDDAVTTHPTKTYLSSIKPIYVTERLNEVFGVGSWQLRLQRIERNPDNGTVVVKDTLTIPEYGVYYESYGGNDNGGSTSKNFDLGDAYKGAATDGLTKICSYLEIGIDVFKGKHKGKKADKKEVPKPTPKAETPKPAAPKVDKPKEPEFLVPGTPNWEYAVKRIKETVGTEKPVTVETILKTFRLSEENLTKLKDETKA